MQDHALSIDAAIRDMRRAIDSAIDGAISRECEACARIADQAGAEAVAAAIRSRGQQEPTDIGIIP